jgi:hypothetical protein
MCFPLRCLKCIVGFSAWVTILLGVASFVFGIVLSVRTSGDSDNYYKALGDVQVVSVNHYRVVKMVS